MLVVAGSCRPLVYLLFVFFLVFLVFGLVVLINYHRAIRLYMLP